MVVACLWNGSVVSITLDRPICSAVVLLFGVFCALLPCSPWMCWSPCTSWTLDLYSTVIHCSYHRCVLFWYYHAWFGWKFLVHCNRGWVVPIDKNGPASCINLVCVWSDHISLDVSTWRFLCPWAHVLERGQAEFCLSCRCTKNCNRGRGIHMQQLIDLMAAFCLKCLWGNIILCSSVLFGWPHSGWEDIFEAYAYVS